MNTLMEDQEDRWNYRRRLNQKDSVMAYPPPISGYVVNGDANLHKELSPPSSSGARISPAVLFIIVILAVLFFISGVLHLLVRFLTKNHSSSQSDRNLEASSSDTLERQLQQLFHLHDSGLDQTFIDALPVFMYKEIVGGAKEPFDCAVCLCEFAEKDQLRLLPMCSHAFHINCIDTWLLSNSTCPLCRDTLFNPEFSPENPAFGFRDFRDDDEYPVSGEVRFSTGLKRVPPIQEVSVEKGVFPVRLGKFRKLDNVIEVGQEDVGETSSSRLDARRCYSMGSYQYVVGDANLRVAALSGGRISRNLNPVSVSGRGGDGNLSPDRREEDGKKISIGSKNDSYSVSKIWLWSKKGKFASSSSSLNMDLPRMQRREGL